MNPKILGGLLRNFYDDFDMDSFENRLKLQKIVYLLKSKGMNLGYSYALYLYGPYSSDLTKDGFQMIDLIDFSSLNKLVPIEMRRDFEEFVGIIREGNRQNNIRWLEIVSSYLFLKKNYEGLSDEEIIAKIKEKRTGFEISDEEIKQIISSTKKEGYFIV